MSLFDVLQIKNSVDITSTIGQFVDLKKHGSTSMGCCPFHSEKTPSFSVNADREFFYCFGCGASGDVIDFIQLYQKCDFQTAVKKLVGVDIFDTITPEQNEAIKQQRAEAQKQRADEQKKRWSDAEKTANKIWSVSETIPPAGHSYLYKKGVTGHGLRVGIWPAYIEKKLVEIPDALLVPVMVGKKIVSLQAIFPDDKNPIQRDKTFLAGGKMAGGYFLIGTIENHETFIICEGYATGASLWDCLQIPVFVAFNAGNLDAVAERVRKAKPTAQIIIAADNDRGKNKNVGVESATNTAKNHGCFVAVPIFDDDDTGTDFNDLHEYAGRDVVRETILAAIPKPNDEHAQNNDVIEHNQNVAIYGRLLDVKKNGQPLATIANLAEIISRLGITIRYNVIKKEEEILIPGKNGVFSIDNGAVGALAFIKSECAKFYYPTERVGDFVTFLADKTPFNPVAEWIISKPWDGVHRLPKMLDTVQSFGTQTAKNKLMTRWFISCVAAAFRPNGISAHGCLVFQGKQSLGKTFWFKSLVPESMGVIADGLMLRPDDKDSVKQIVSNWLCELGELDATFRRSDIAQLKSWLTRDRDTIRRPYAARESTYARRTICFASVNPREYLHDTTGNRRFWTVECKNINWNHDIDTQQFWAEVYENLYLAGEQWHLKPDEMEYLTESNKDFEVIDPIDEQIKTRFDWDKPRNVWEWRTATDILLDVGFINPTQGESTRAAHIVRQLNENQGKRGHGGRVLLIPPIKTKGFYDNGQAF